MKPDNFEDVSAVIALYRPGPMGANSHINYALRKNKQQEITPIHAELAGLARGHPRHDLRPDRLSGAGHGDRAEGRGLHAGPSRPAAPRDGQEEEGDPGQGVRGLRAGHAGQRLLRKRRSRPSGTSWSRSPTTPSTRRTPPPTASSRTGRRTSRRTTRPSTWPRCSPRIGDNKDKSAIYLAECRRWASRCCRRTSTSPSASSPRSARTSASVSARSATSVRTSSTRSSRRARRRGSSSTSPTSCARSTPRPATRRSSSR